MDVATYAEALYKNHVYKYPRFRPEEDIPWSRVLECIEEQNNGTQCYEESEQLQFDTNLS